MLFNKPTNAFEDDRGAIKDLLVHEPIDSITVITSKKGVARGNHYHKDTAQWVYVQSGRLKALTQNEGEDVVITILETGDVQKAEPLERHALIALEDTEFFVFTKGPRGGESYEDDTYRLREPLRDPNDD